MRVLVVGAVLSVHRSLISFLRSSDVAVDESGTGCQLPLLRCGQLRLDRGSHEAWVGDRPVHLTGKEYAVLELLVLRKGMALTKLAFLSHIYGGLDEMESKIIDVFICTLRRKLAEAGAPDMIATVWGRGYTMRHPGHDPGGHPTHPAVVPWTAPVLALST